MTARLGQDPVFATGFGAEPTIQFKWSPECPDLACFEVKGPVGVIMVQFRNPPAFLERPAKTKLILRICPERTLAKAFGCDFFYAGATPVEGDIIDISGFLVAAEDMLAEFLADVAVSPMTEKFLPGAT